MKKLIILSAFLIIVLNLKSQEKAGEWIFFKESNNIKVYSRSSENSTIKELKLTTTAKTSTKKVVSLITNVERLPTWGYACKESILLKQVSANELYYYYAVDVPWPIEDRDVVINMKITHDTVTGVSKITTRNADNYIPEKEGVTRIYYVRAQWVFTPIKTGLIQIDFTIAADFGGNFPDWILNHAMSYSPIKSIVALKEKVEDKN